MALVERYHRSLLRVARRYVSSPEAAEEVVQETWLAVLNGIDRFEGRSSLKTWLFRILTNQALTRRSREARREIAFSELADDEASGDEPAVDDSRFHRMLFLRGAWRDKPKPWEQSPEELALSAEVLGVVESAIGRLPEAQATVITLRDVQGFSADEVCEALSISEGNQRVLLHRARSKVRQALETHLAEGR
jgi:RNA polymerase sigma-70 factor (ECF subfamily)